MLKRLLTGIVILLVSVGFFALRYVSAYFFDAYLMTITLFCVFEVSRTLNNNRKRNDMGFLVSFPVLGYIVLILCSSFKLNIIVFYGLLLALCVVILFVTLLVNLLSKNRINKEMVDVNYIGTYKQYVAKKTVLNLFLMVYPTIVLFQMFVINHLSGFTNFENIADLNVEAFLLILMFATTIITDTGAYLVGKSIGGPKLCSKISPKKTISGAVGGVILSVVLGIGLYFLFALWGYAGTFDTFAIKLWKLAMYGFVASIFTQIGDICASVVKRRNGIKDYGNIFPGHGGMMDRVDGLMFNSVATLIFAIIVFI